MVWQNDLAGQLKDNGNGNMSVDTGYEEGSEEEEPYEREFYDDDDDDDSQDVEQCVDPMPKEEAREEEPCYGTALHQNEDASDVETSEVELGNEEGSGDDSFYEDYFIDELDPRNDLVSHEGGFVDKKSIAMQAFKKEQNKPELQRALRQGSSMKQKEVLVSDEVVMKPFKKRLSVKFATDVCCYNTEIFAAAKLEKRKALFDDQGKHVCKRQEHTLSLPHDGGKLNEVDSTNLYVANLPPSVVSHKLIELFLPFGRIVRSRVMDDRFTGLSLGYGFVKYADPSCAAEAIKHMNGRLVEGKALEVRVAGVPPSGSNPLVHAMSESDCHLSKETKTTDLYICNLPLYMSSEELLKFFLPFGEVIDAKVIKDYTTGLSKGYGFVKYSNSLHATEAVNHLNGYLVEGKKIVVKVSGISPTRSTVESHANTKSMKEIDMANLYVCNIPSSIDSNKLVELFVPFGKITHARVLADQATNSGRGYGFIKFADAGSAAEAIESMNGALIEGESIVVRVAGLSPSASSSAVQQHSPHSIAELSPETNKCRLYIANLPRSMNADKLVNLFSPFGQISKILMNLEYGLVWYADELSTIMAVKHMDGYFVEGKRLVVKKAESCPTNAAEHALSLSVGKPMKEIDMANLYVGRVPSTVTGDQLVELFCPFGEIIQARMFKLQGYGMVRYANPSCAAAAIDHMDGYQIGGSTLVVRVAGLPAEFNAATKAPQMTGNDNRHVDMTNLYVCHLPYYVTTEKLIEIFLPCGQITQAKVVVDRYTGVSKGFGFVKFAHPYSAAVAITNMNGCPLDGHVLEVRIAGVQPSAVSSYMAHFYAHFTSPDPMTMAVGIPTSDWPYHYAAESAYAASAEKQGQGILSATAATAQIAQHEGLPEANPVGSAAEKGSSVPNHLPGHSQAVSWAGPPGFEPHVVSKKDANTMNPSQACSKVHMAQSGSSQKRRSIV